MKNTSIIGSLIITMVIVIAMMSTQISCKPQSETQIKTIAQQAGLFSVVGWIAYDNPGPEIKSAVEEVVQLINDNAFNVGEGKTYTEVLYPVVLQYIVNNIDPQYRPLTKAGSLSLLNGIDVMLAVNPSWSEKEGLVIDVIKSFCTGAAHGLNLSNDSPVIKASLRSARLRSNLELSQ